MSTGITYFKSTVLNDYSSNVTRTGLFNMLKTSEDRPGGVSSPCGFADICNFVYVSGKGSDTHTVHVLMQFLMSSPPPIY